MKKLTILSVLLVSFSVMFAQTATDKATVTWGGLIKASKRQVMSDVVAKHSTGMYVLSVEPKLSHVEYSVSQIDNSMNVLTTKKIEITEDKKERDFQFMVYSEGQFFLFSSFINSKQKKNYLFLQGFDQNSLIPMSNAKMIAEIDYSEGSRRNAGDFSLCSSMDSSRYMIFYNLPYEKNSPEKFGFQVYDNNMTLQWKKDISLPYADKLFSVEDYQVDNKGNVWLLGKLYNEVAKEKRRGEVNYKYVAICYADQGNTVKEYPIEYGDKFLTDMKMIINPNGDLNCAGFFSSKGTFSIKGIYYMVIDGVSKEVKVFNTKDFEIDFIVEGMSEKKAEKMKEKAEKGKDVELYEFDLDNLIMKDDGGLIMLAEQFYIKVTTHTTTNSSGQTTTRTVYHYFFKDIIAVNISPFGDIVWTTKIPKFQHTVNDGGYFSSYAFSVVKDNIYLVFNDNMKNLFLKEGDRYQNAFASKSSNIVALVQLSSDGKYTREALCSYKEAGGLFCKPNVSRQISDTEMVMFFMKGSKQRFAKLTFK